ncbi:class A beta-lactamase [Streptomyces sp. NBC_01216]|uniref:class A beta-lactamase n=1 Tax=unclassified Streptomyces TaxID=2593676 RepID=UPI002E106BAA|nr:class A beta-lactamase [Streptomyces sp. NBC_01216]
MNRTSAPTRGPLRAAAAAALALLFAAPTACAPAPAAGTAAALPRPSAAQEASLAAELRGLEADRAVRVGAYAYDTGTGRTVSYRGEEDFPVLSTFKAFVAAAILDKARRVSPGLLDRTVHWTTSEEVPDSPTTAGRGATGMTVAELCRAAVTRSDNTAGNLLLKEIGGPSGLTRYHRSLGDRVTRLDRWEPELNDWRPGEPRDTTRPAAIGRALRRVTLGPALVPADRARLIDWLRATTTGGERVRAGLPEGWDVGDKTGTSGSYGGAHDIAVVRPPSGAPVVIAVYTRRTSATEAPDSVAVARTAAVLVRALGLTP